VDPQSTQGQEPVISGQVPVAEPQAAGQVPQPKTFDETYVKQLRDEAAASRTAKAAAEARVRELEAANLSEQEKKDLRLKELEERDTRFQGDLKDANTRTTAYKAAAELGMTLGAADVALRLVEPSEIEYGDDGKPTNLKALFEAKLKEYPALLNPAGAPALPSSGGPANPARSTDKQVPFDPNNVWAGVAFKD
jgi:hypothetical protein